MGRRRNLSLHIQGENYLRLHEEFQPGLKSLYPKRISARTENREENEWKLLFHARLNKITWEIFSPVRRDLGLPRPGWNFTLAVQAETFSM